MTNSIHKLRDGELLQICREIINQREVYERYPLTAPFGPLLEHSEQALAESKIPSAPALDPRERAALERELERLDATFDQEVRGLHALLEALAVARPERATLYRGCSQALFPEGRRVTTSSLRNEAGQASGLAVLRERPAIREALAVRIDDEPLDAGLGRLIAAAEGISERIGRLAPSEARRTRAQLNERLAARSRLIGALGQLRSSAELAGWSEEDMQVVFGPLDALIAR